MTSLQQTIYLFTMITSLLIFAFLLTRAWRNYLSRGARSFLLMIFVLIGFQAFFLTSNFAATADDRKMIMNMAFFFLCMFPLTWIIMVREIAELDRSRSGRVLIPLGILNMAISLVITLSPTIYYFSQCYSRGGTMVFCATHRSPVWMALIGILVIEIVWGAVFLLNHYRRNQNVKERAQALSLIFAVAGIPILTIIVLLLSNDLLISPMPFAVFLAGVLLYNAVFNYKILALRFSESQMIPMVEDLMLVVNTDHIVQDFNLSTLNVFNMQVRNLVNVQLEHAFVDHPEIIALFTQERVVGNVELVVDGVKHVFEPNKVVVMDQESGEEIGQRLRLKDVTEQPDEGTGVRVMRDSATNLYNQVSFYTVGETILSYAKQKQVKLAVIVMGIDHLRRYEEKYTHAVVDALLKQIVDKVKPKLNPSDLMARLDNDSLVFLVNFPEDSSSTALELCFRMKSVIMDEFFEFEEQRIQLTVSQGYTVYDSSEGTALEQLVQVSQKTLRNLQAEGNNSIEFISPSE